MRQPPFYFEPIRQRAVARWEQLERDAELAGPWHQLFKQVQSPRHVLSELLQNADDAGATEALVRIEDEIFTFEHNGEDFTKEHFASLCRFGYSNKRVLHTIGFRGIGFKCTFSLGDCVDLLTPSLAVRFHRQRFTEPHWLSEQVDTAGRTCVRVRINDRHRRKETEKNLDEWRRSPISLLFFRNIRCLQIGDHTVRWDSLGPGPIPDSEWMALHGHVDEKYLLIRSVAEPFFEETLEEIRQERMLGVGEETEFPPCRVEIVLGAKGRLYVVLPTGVETKLPFACNAPFVQDPARLKIKDPETSPTNRWLLERAGKLAVSAMLHWLGRTEASLAERAHAYSLFPDVDREDSSLEGVCGTIAQMAFADAIEGSSLLLTEDGCLVSKMQSLIIPRQVLDIWPAEQAAALFDDTRRPALCRHVDQNNRAKLRRWKVVDEVTEDKILEILQSRHLPKPKTWRQLLTLWAYLAPKITGYRRDVAAQDVRIVPVQGKNVLYAASEVVRLGEKKLLQSDEDWRLLAAYLVVVDQNWLRFLAEQRRAGAEKEDRFLQDAVNATYTVLKETSLDDTSDVNKIINQVAAEFFSRESVSLQECVQFTQIAAKLNADFRDTFRYVTRDERLRSAKETILFDENGKLEELLPESVRECQLLHSAYDASFDSCSREEFLKWIISGRAGLSTFVTLVNKRINIYGRQKIECEARKRGLRDRLWYQYVTDEFVINDWDFEDLYWHHWKTLAADDDHVWVKVVDRILSQHEGYWTQAKNAELLQVATTGKTRQIPRASVPPAWVLQLRELSCMLDNRGFRYKPGDLLRRTPETESLMDIEPFVDWRLDCEKTRPLLDLLGVRNTPTGPDRLLDCVRALSKARKPPVHEVEKLYRRLDQMVNTCSTADFEKIKEAFQAERLIFTQDNVWVSSSAVFLAADEDDVPGAAVVRPSVSELSIWRKIEIAERPTADLAIKWLKGLPSGEPLAQDDSRRVRALLRRHPVRIWEECGHWFNLAGEWAPVAELSYALTMQTVVPGKQLYPAVKQRTADFLHLPAEVSSSPPFSQLPALAAIVRERFEHVPQLNRPPVRKEWLTTLGAELRRIQLDTEEDTRRVRALADTLARTSWYETPELAIIPYIDGTPVGTPRLADIAWLDQALYVTPLSEAKLARRVPEEIGRVFGRPEIQAALAYSFNRSPEDVREYLEENFALALPNQTVESGQAAENGHSSGGLQVEAIGNGQITEHGDTRSNNSSADANEETVQGSNLDIPDRDELPTPSPSGLEGAHNPTPHPRPQPKPPRPSLIELFATTRGFQKDGTHRFFHQDGSWIGQNSESSFLWEHRTESEGLVRRYLPLDCCLQREPLELDADVWAQLVRHPESCALILSTLDGGPVEMTGSQLCGMRDRGEITLYPARYRIVHELGAIRSET